ncbi:hypothetical protein GCM10010124_13470 [Pilimelia terevasa]|uniref:Uncharacterized protein n=1 Tax=Pilimelia terevasa TaxID=53372 RepID=A0A8J3BHV6_9ACTN|nr:hypothetical protein [Pilimelia terevasa]GGK22310.1 hypothetical protein GCM10010124_13470 [Pilimelia terevasa]
MSLPHFPRTALATAALLVGTLSVPAPTPASAALINLPLWRSTPSIDEGLVTNEFATYNPLLSISRYSPDWVMSSGSLFAVHSPYGPAYYSGHVDDREPDALSARSTNSAIFRMVSRRDDFRNNTVRLKIRVTDQRSTRSTPRSDWDGVHLWLRHQSETHTYYASLARRDGRMVIKKKCPGGRINGGRYYELSDEIDGFPIYEDEWKRFTVTIRNNSSGSVTIGVYRLDKLVLRAVDDGVGCEPITSPGQVGIRGDNTEFAFADFEVDPWESEPGE